MIRFVIVGVDQTCNDVLKGLKERGKFELIFFGDGLLSLRYLIVVGVLGRDGFGVDSLSDSEVGKFHFCLLGFYNGII